VFGGAQKDVAASRLDLPPAPDEPKTDALAKSSKLCGACSRGHGGSMRQIPHTGQRRTWVNDAEDWANRQLRGISERLAKSATRNSSPAASLR
jgi:hypothetical protein